MTEQEKVPLISSDQSTQCGNGVESDLDKGHCCCNHNFSHGGHSRPCNGKQKSKCPFHKGMKFFGNLMLFVLLVFFFHGLFEHSTRPILEVVSGSSLRMSINRYSKASKIEFPNDWMIKIKPSLSKYRKFDITSQVIIMPQNDVQIRYKEVISAKLKDDTDNGRSRVERHLRPIEYFPSPSEFNGDSRPIFSLIRSQCLREGFIKGAVIVRARRASHGSCHPNRILAEQIVPLTISCSSSRDILVVIDMVFESHDKKASQEIAKLMQETDDKSASELEKAIKDAHLTVDDASRLRKVHKKHFDGHEGFAISKLARKAKRSNERDSFESELPETIRPFVEAVEDKIDV